MSRLRRTREATGRRSRCARARLSPCRSEAGRRARSSTGKEAAGQDRSPRAATLPSQPVGIANDRCTARPAPRCRSAGRGNPPRVGAAADGRRATAVGPGVHDLGSVGSGRAPSTGSRRGTPRMSKAGPSRALGLLAEPEQLELARSCRRAPGPGSAMYRSTSFAMLFAAERRVLEHEVRSPARAASPSRGCRCRRRAATPATRRTRASRAGRGRPSRGPSRRRGARCTGPSPRRRPSTRGGGGTRAALELLGDRDLEVVPGHGLVVGERPRPRSAAAFGGLDVLTSTARAATRPSAGWPVVGERRVLLLVGRHLEDHARGARQAAEPVRASTSGALEARAAFSNTSLREAKNSVGSRAARQGEAERRGTERAPREVDELAVDAVDLVVAGPVDAASGVDVERGVHPDEVVIAGVAAGDRAHARLAVRACGGQDLVHEGVVEPDERRAGSSPRRPRAARREPRALVGGPAVESSRPSSGSSSGHSLDRRVEDLLEDRDRAPDRRHARDPPVGQARAQRRPAAGRCRRPSPASGRPSARRPPASRGAGTPGWSGSRPARLERVDVPLEQAGRSSAMSAASEPRSADKVVRSAARDGRSRARRRGRAGPRSRAIVARRAGGRVIGEPVVEAAGRRCGRVERIASR